MIAWLVFLFWLTGCAATINPDKSIASPGIPLESCQLASPDLPLREEAECGSLDVPEDPGVATSQKIRLRLAVVRSISRSPAPDPLFFIPGGPGEAATESYLAVSSAFERILQDRDIILVDQRGTGGSHPLRCPSSETGPEASRDPQGTRQYLETCLAGLEGDPALYTTIQAVEDLEQVRSAMRFERINLYGGSYGTRVALAYLRRYPERVRAVILDGVAPPNWTLGAEITTDAQRALDLIFQRCAADPQCHTAFPDLPARFRALAQALRDGPVELTLDDPTNGEKMNFTLTYDFFASAIHTLSYTPETAALLPLLIHTAYEQNDFSLIAAQGLITTQQVAQGISMGMRFSVLCAEDVPYFDNLSPAGRAEGYLGDYFVNTFSEICQVWPHRQAPASFKEPVKANVPVLLLSGEADPVTPPANGDLTAQTLPNSLHLVIPAYGHINIFRGCLPQIAARFIESGEVAGLDTGCFQALHPVPFFLTFSGPAP